MFFRHCLINSQGSTETANIVLEFTGRKLAAIHIFQIVFNNGITFRVNQFSVTLWEIS